MRRGCESVSWAGMRCGETSRGGSRMGRIGVWGEIWFVFFFPFFFFSFISLLFFRVCCSRLNFWFCLDPSCAPNVCVIHPKTKIRLGNISRSWGNEEDTVRRFLSSHRFIYDWLTYWHPHRIRVLTEIEPDWWEESYPLIKHVYVVTNGHCFRLLEYGHEYRNKHAIATSSWSPVSLFMNHIVIVYVYMAVLCNV